MKEGSLTDSVSCLECASGFFVHEHRSSVMSTAKTNCKTPGLRLWAWEEGGMLVGLRVCYRVAIGFIRLSSLRHGQA